MMTKRRLCKILADIQIFDRLFEVTGPVTVQDDEGVTNGWHVQVCYYEPDVLKPNGNMELQKSRTWFIWEGASESEVVDTAFAAVMRSYDHVVQEHFTYKGKRIFSPHFTVGQRLSMATDCPVCNGPHDDNTHRQARANGQ
jgi:hypothetical protein